MSTLLQSQLSEKEQVSLLSNLKKSHTPFENKLSETGLFPLLPTNIEILQVNVGYECNQTCTHCHVNAGPDRKESATKETLQQCLDAIDNSSIKTVDLTGGAPEMNQHFEWFLDELGQREIHIIVRSNLTILMQGIRYRKMIDLFVKHKVEVISSLPCYTEENTDKQRGDGVFQKSIAALRLLNAAGYGQPGPGLEINLVYNPGGAFLPGNQMSLEKDYKRELLEKYNIVFNNLYTITNLPINRFLEHLQNEGQLTTYMDTLVNAYNPAAAAGVMCRNTISVRWDGYLYDCDFNQMLDMKLDSTINHIADFNQRVLQKREIVLNQHCYGCTAGEGSSCQGALV